MSFPGRAPAHGTVVQWAGDGQEKDGTTGRQDRPTRGSVSPTASHQESFGPVSGLASGRRVSACLERRLPVPCTVAFAARDLAYRCGGSAGLAVCSHTTHRLPVSSLRQRAVGTPEPCNSSADAEFTQIEAALNGRFGTPAPIVLVCVRIIETFLGMESSGNNSCKILRIENPRIVISYYLVTSHKYFVDVGIYVALCSEGKQPDAMDTGQAWSNRNKSAATAAASGLLFDELIGLTSLGLRGLQSGRSVTNEQSQQNP